MNRDSSVGSIFSGIECIDTMERIPSETLDTEVGRIETKQVAEKAISQHQRQDWLNLLACVAIGSIIMLSSGIALSFATFKVIQALQSTMHQVYAPVYEDF